MEIWFQSNLKIHNYDTNKFEKFLINDLDWKFRNFSLPSGVQGSFRKIKECQLWDKKCFKLQKWSN